MSENVSDAVFVTLFKAVFVVVFMFEAVFMTLLVIVVEIWLALLLSQC